jgi:hypothetical protein
MCGGMLIASNKQFQRMNVNFYWRCQQCKWTNGEHFQHLKDMQQDLNDFISFVNGMEMSNPLGIIKDRLSQCKLAKEVMFQNCMWNKPNLNFSWLTIFGLVIYFQIYQGVVVVVFHFPPFMCQDISN